MIIFLPEGLRSASFGQLSYGRGRSSNIRQYCHKEQGEYHENKNENQNESERERKRNDNKIGKKMVKNGKIDNA